MKLRTSTTYRPQIRPLPARASTPPSVPQSQTWSLRPRLVEHKKGVVLETRGQLEQAMNFYTLRGGSFWLESEFQRLNEPPARIEQRLGASWIPFLKAKIRRINADPTCFDLEVRPTADNHSIEKQIFPYTDLVRQRLKLEPCLSGFSIDIDTGGRPAMYGSREWHGPLKDALAKHLPKRGAAVADSVFKYFCERERLPPKHVYPQTVANDENEFAVRAFARDYLSIVFYPVLRFKMGDKEVTHERVPLYTPEAKAKLENLATTICEEMRQSLK